MTDQAELPPEQLPDLPAKLCAGCGQHHKGAESLPCPYMQAYS